MQARETEEQSARAQPVRPSGVDAKMAVGPIFVFGKIAEKMSRLAGTHIAGDKLRVCTNDEIIYIMVLNDDGVVIIMVASLTTTTK